MCNPRTKFDVFTITGNEKMKGNARRKTSRFEPQFGDLGWFDGKRIIDFLLVIELYSLALCGTIEQNLSKSEFSEGEGHFERKFLLDGDVARNPSMDR